MRATANDAQKTAKLLQDAIDNKQTTALHGIPVGFYAGQGSDREYFAHSWVQNFAHRVSQGRFEDALFGLCEQLNDPTPTNQK